MAQRKINGAAVKALREAIGISQTSLAYRVGVTGGNLSYVEHGKRDVSPALHRRLADALGVELDAISIVVPTTDTEVAA